MRSIGLVGPAGVRSRGPTVSAKGVDSADLGARMKNTLLRTSFLMFLTAYAYQNAGYSAGGYANPYDPVALHGYPDENGAGGINPFDFPGDCYYLRPATRWSPDPAKPCLYGPERSKRLRSDAYPAPRRSNQRQTVQTPSGDQPPPRAVTRPSGSSTPKAPSASAAHSSPSSSAPSSSSSHSSHR